LSQEHQVKLSESSISRLLSHLGLSPQRPVYKSYKQNPGKVNTWNHAKSQWGKRAIKSEGEMKKHLIINDAIHSKAQALIKSFV
jgi:hypothetical protein